MSYQYHPGAAQGGQAPAQSSPPWPGKRAPTDNLSRMTGVPIIDAGGAVCERDGVPASAVCFLSQRDRSRQTTTLDSRVRVAHNYLDDALENARLKALETREGYGPLAVIFINALQALGIEVLAKAVLRMRNKAVQAALEADMSLAYGGEGPALPPWQAITAQLPFTEDQLTNSISHICIGTRTRAEAAARQIPPDAAALARFLAAQRDALHYHGAEIVERLPAVLDDTGLVLLTESYHPDLHPPSLYTAMVDSLIERYKTSEIGFVGRSFEHDPTLKDSDYARAGRLDVVTFTTGGRTRHALVETMYIHRRMDDAFPGSARPTDARTLPWTKWVRWLDDDLAPAAIEAHRARVGAVHVVNLDEDDCPPNCAAEVLAWLNEIPWARGGRR